MMSKKLGKYLGEKVTYSPKDLPLQPPSAMTYDVKPQATASSTSGLSTRDRTSPPLINDSNTEEHRDDSKRQVTLLNVWPILWQPGGDNEFNCG